MPEGDTIHRLATRLSAKLPGENVTYAWDRRHGLLKRLVGERVLGAEALGKNLLLGLSGGWTYRIHLSIGGRCRSRPHDERSRNEKLPLRWATLVLDTDGHRTVVWKTSRVELMRTAHVRVAAGIRTIGPDLLAEGCDMNEVMRRARATGNREREVGELLQDQRVAAGIGNVIRCEALFLSKLDPWKKTEAVDDGDLRACFDHAKEILERSIATGKRDTTSQMGERFFVYGRTGRPCLVCGAMIRQQRQGDLARVTPHCPGCQKSGGGAQK